MANNDKAGPVVVAILVAAGFFICGLLIGSEVERNCLHRWALDNGFAHFDQKTGELILHKKGGE